ncbi:hypothetical protein HHK36_030870 [Tetracentron sinense]|uniref:Uncharacterized protein n=1 Tax=Tetracentron sinense TaxID=13715 RepID=A0A834YDK7_TETSI|nr:hypothetical protein HHK36_030870 [Tetracentron sinense]
MPDTVGVAETRGLARVIISLSLSPSLSVASSPDDGVLINRSDLNLSSSKHSSNVISLSCAAVNIFHSSPTFPYGSENQFSLYAEIQGKGWLLHMRTRQFVSSSRPHGLCSFQNTRSIILCTINMTAGGSDDSRKINLDRILDKPRQFLESFPQPVKSFPWIRALENFVQLILDLICAVIKYLCVPMLAVSSLSEMSYSAHERKLFLVPFPLLAGIAVAGVLRDTALELSPLLKEAEVPWHLIVIAIAFTLLKLPGPYYPYWGRIFIPHFANGGLFRTLWFVFLWFRRPREVSGTKLQQTSVDGSHSEQKKL